MMHEYSITFLLIHAGTTCAGTNFSVSQ